TSLRPPADGFARLASVAAFRIERAPRRGIELTVREAARGTPDPVRPRPGARSIDAQRGRWMQRALVLSPARVDGRATMAQEGTGLVGLLERLRWRWKLAVLVAIPLFLGALAYTQLLPNRYSG